MKGVFPCVECSHQSVCDPDQLTADAGLPEQEKINAQFNKTRVNACSCLKLPRSACSQRRLSLQFLRQHSCATKISWPHFSGACSARHLLLSSTKQEKSADVENTVVKYDPSDLSYKIVQPL